MEKGTVIDTEHTKYSVVKEAFSRYGITSSPKSPNAPFIWFDGTIPSDFFYNLNGKQRINKIPGMDVICFKSNTFTALNTMRQSNPKVYNFYPLTFILPNQYSDLHREHIKECNKCIGSVTWIVKPRAGCCGNGIKLIQNVYELKNDRSPCIVQNYIRPYLVDGYKFDFRFYMCISTLKPYTVYIYNEGLARFCTKKYKPPTRQTLDDKYVHLTNTSVNVTNTLAGDMDFTKLARTVMAEITAKDARGKELWNKIKRAATLTAVAIYPSITAAIKKAELEKKAFFKSSPQIAPPVEDEKSLPLIRRYFHIIGIDIMLNEDMNPVVLELNDRPSMHVTFDIEQTLKTQMVYDTLSLITADGTMPDPEKTSKNWELLLPLNETTKLGQTVHEVIQKKKRDIYDKRSMFRTVRTVRTVNLLKPILPPLVKRTSL